MFALLQVYPPEAGDSDDWAPRDVFVVDASRARLEQFLDSYRERYAAAVAEFETWDRDRGDDWTPEHDCRLEDLAFEHQVYGSLIPETRFEIVEVLGELEPSVGPWDAPEPPGVRPAA